MKIPKLLNGELDWVTLFDESIFRTTKDDIDIELLERFVIDAMFPTVSYFEEPSPFTSVTTDSGAAMHAAELIILVMGAIRKGEKLDTTLKSNLGERKERSNLFYPNKTTSKDVAWQIAKERMLGKRNWVETIAKWKEKVCYGSNRTIKGWVAELEPSIRETFTPDEELAYLKTGHAKKLE